jgi:hypothetical protein
MSDTNGERANDADGTLFGLVDQIIQSGTTNLYPPLKSQADVDLVARKLQAHPEVRKDRRLSDRASNTGFRAKLKNKLTEPVPTPGNGQAAPHTPVPATTAPKAVPAAESQLSPVLLEFSDLLDRKLKQHRTTLDEAATLEVIFAEIWTEAPHLKPSCAYLEPKFLAKAKAAQSRASAPATKPGPAAPTVAVAPREKSAAAEPAPKAPSPPVAPQTAQPAPSGVSSERTSTVVPDPTASDPEKMILEQRVRQALLKTKINRLAKEQDDKDRPAPELKIRMGTEVQHKKLQTVFGGRFTKGAFQLMVGPGEAGKGMVSAAIIAKFTTGEPFPGDDPKARRHPMTVLICVTEDSVDRVTARLVAAGADKSRFAFVEGPPQPTGGLLVPSPIAFDSDAGALLAKIKEIGAEVLWLETTVAHLGDREGKKRWSTNNEKEVRDALAPIVAVCRDGDLIGWGVMHPRKSMEGGIADSISGSAAFGNAGRGVLHVWKDPRDADAKSPWRLLASSKANYRAERPTTLRFRIEPWDQDPDEGRVVWPTKEQGLVDPRSAEDVWDEIKERNKVRRDYVVMDAEKLLTDLLAGGATKTVDEIKLEAKARGVNMSAVERAKVKLGIESFKSAFDGKWGWRFPKDEL